MVHRFAVKEIRSKESPKDPPITEDEFIAKFDEYLPDTIVEKMKNLAPAAFGVHLHKKNIDLEKVQVENDAEIALTDWFARAEQVAFAAQDPGRLRENRRLSREDEQESKEAVENPNAAPKKKKVSS